MNKNQANEILSSMIITLQAKFGEDFDIKFGKTTFDTNGKINFKVSLTDKSAATLVKENDDLLGMRKNNVSVDASGFSFVFGGNVHTVTKINTRKMKYCVEARRFDGKSFRFTAKFINEEIRKATGKTHISWRN